jgi:ribosomal protein S6E (S10)
METVTNNTEAVIYGMLTENTGGSILDSGSAYGRNWERNQKKTLEDFRAEPEATFTGGEWPEISKSTFWHLVNHLESDATLNAAFNKFAEDYPEESWLEIIELWFDKLGVPEDGDFYSPARWDFNSYNFDGWLIDQTLQGSFFGMGGNEYLILQVHGGCDVRGGYTRPQVFALNSWNGKDDFIFNAEQADFLCSSPDCTKRLSVRGYEVDVCDEDGNALEGVRRLEDAKTCPCGNNWKN